MKESEKEPEFISLAAAAQQFGASVSTLRMHVRRGHLAAIRFSPRGKIFVSPSAIRRLARPVQPDLSASSRRDFKARLDAIFERALSEPSHTRRPRH